VWLGLQLGDQHVNFAIKCVLEEVFLQVFLFPYFSIFSSVDRNTEKEVLRFFCSMVVAQPQWTAILGKLEAATTFVQFGREYTDQMHVFDCSTFFISFGGY
jgi:hypothetical protein